MAVYVLAQLKFTDRVAYGRYQERFMDVMRKFRGRLLAADEHPTVLEGTWEGDKVVLLSFPDEPAYREWGNSPEYQEILQDRKAGAAAIALLIKGVSRAGDEQ